ncbi:unnamed protein product [Rotaria sordida]|uniref:Transmembrane protein n=1 Tax=Rotaria sordida TaxID=392033 RepID=A0A813YLP1_9BILA|nr:unnamed protein product [Rotaria sordida]
MMAKFTILINIIISLLIFLIHLSSVMSINDQCDDKIFILISKKNIFLFNFDSQHDYSPSIIYETKLNTTIENGSFNKRINTIILLINQLNETYSIVTLNVYDTIYNYWLEKSNNIKYSSYIYISLGQRYLYVLNNQTMLLQIFTLPLTLTSYKENYLINLPKNQTILNYVIDEIFDFLWILFENIQPQLYICQLKTFNCYLYMNLINLNQPLQLYINWKYQKLYINSKNSLIIFDYNQNHTDYTIHNLNSTEENQIQFLTICEKTNFIEYITIDYTNKQQICLQTCQYLPLILNDTNRIHTIQRFSILSNIFYCSQKRRIAKIIILILILIDIAVILAIIIWLAYKYFYQSTLKENERQMSSGTVWTADKDSVTHF